MKFQKNYFLRITIIGALAIIWNLGFGIGDFVSAATNIDTQNAGYRWAWNDVIGWVNMRGPDNVRVTASSITGWATSSVGVIMFDCANTPGGDICSTSNFQTVNDGAGYLSGWAWNDTVGWISWCGTETGASTWNGSTWVCPSSPKYRAHIDSSGDGINSFFHDWAWNDVVGWLDFNCANKTICGTSDFKVQTEAGSKIINATLTSTIFDIGASNGSLNTIVWRGSQPAGTSVQFQLATAESASGPWTDSAYGSLFIAPANVPIQLTKSFTGVEVENRRYLRYKTLLSTDVWQTAGPRIDDIIINWSP